MDNHPDRIPLRISRGMHRLLLWCASVFEWIGLVALSQALFSPNVLRTVRVLDLSPCAIWDKALY